MSAFMKCGCIAQGVLENNNPVCTSHWNITPDALVVSEPPPELETRKATCSYCGCEAESKNWMRLAFFSYLPHRSVDSFYCGCKGWN